MRSKPPPCAASRSGSAQEVALHDVHVVEPGEILACGLDCPAQVDGDDLARPERAAKKACRPMPAARVEHPLAGEERPSMGSSQSRNCSSNSGWISAKCCHCHPNADAVSRCWSTRSGGTSRGTPRGSPTYDRSRRRRAGPFRRQRRGRSPVGAGRRRAGRRALSTRRYSRGASASEWALAIGVARATPAARSSIQRRCQSWKTKSVQSCLRWSRRPARCSDTSRSTSPDRRCPAAEALGGKLVLERLAQLGLEPARRSGCRSPSSRVRRCPAGRTSRHRALEEVLRLEAAELEPRRHPSEELHELDVEERRPDLERARHARPVDLHEDVVLQVRRRVEVDRAARAGRRVGRVANARRCSAKGSAGCATEQRACSAGVNEPSQVGCRTSGGSARPAEEALELEVEAEVRRRDGQPVGERDDDSLVEQRAASR